MRRIRQTNPRRATKENHWIFCVSMADHGFRHSFNRYAPSARPRNPNRRRRPHRGDLTTTVFDGVITAQRVVVPRSLEKVRATMRTLCAMNGEQYIYSWQVNDRKNNRKVQIEGATIKLANDLARTWGNNQLDIRVFDDGPTHWMMYGRFVDLETGFSLTRPFRQRHEINMNMRGDNADRQEDMAFQIGVSKCLRNVVVNGLSTEASFSVDQAKKGLVSWVEQNPERAVEYIKSMISEHSIPLLAVESIVGIKMGDWSPRDTAGVVMQMRSVSEGMITAAELFPTADEAQAVQASKDARRTGDKAEAARSVADNKAEGEAITAGAEPQSEAQAAGTGPQNVAALPDAKRRRRTKGQMAADEAIKAAKTMDEVEAARVAYFDAYGIWPEQGSAAEVEDVEPAPADPAPDEDAETGEPDPMLDGINRVREMKGEEPLAPRTMPVAASPTMGSSISFHLIGRRPMPKSVHQTVLARSQAD